MAETVSRQAERVGSTWPENGRWFALVLLGFAARIGLWLRSIGSNDALIWRSHADHLAHHGLNQTYEQVQAFNHPPIVGLYARWGWSSFGDDAQHYAMFIKIPGLVGEIIALAVLWRFASPRAAAAYACLPAAILISGFHGNTDCLMAAFVLCSAIAFDRHRLLLAGLLFGCSLDVKLVPLVLLPMLLIALPTIRALVQLMVGMSLPLLSFVPSLVGAGHAMYRNMIAYSSNPDNWGVLSVLNPATDKQRLAGAALSARTWYLANGRYVTILAIIAVALLSRTTLHLPMSGQFAVGASLFLLLAPGFGVQYVAFVTPLLCFVDVGAGIRWGITAGLFVGCVYWVFVVSWDPIQSLFTTIYPAPAPILGGIAWFVLLDFVVRYLTRSRDRSTPVTAPTAPVPQTMNLSPA